MDFEDALDRTGSLKEADGRGHTQNISDEGDLERVADASIDPEAVDPSRVDIGGGQPEPVTQEPAEKVNETPLSDEIEEDLEPVEEETKYDKEVVDQISESLSVLTPEGGSSDFFSDVMSEFGESRPDTDEIKDEMLDAGYSADEIEDELDSLEENHLVNRGELSGKAYAVAEFAAEIHGYLSGLRDEVEELEDDFTGNRLVENVDLELENSYFGRAAESFTDNSEMESVGSFISPFDRTGAQRNKETNPLMAFLVAAEKGDRHDIGDLTGYASDESASERVRQIANEGYLDAGEEGRVETTEAGKYLKSAVDDLYEKFEDVIEQESKRKRRIERAQKHLEYREEQRQAAEELDQVARQMKSAENMDWSSSKQFLKNSYSPLARQMSDEYETDLEPDTDMEV